jgi:hypothetical protein
MPLKLQRVIFWAIFWGIVAAILYLVSVIFVLILGLTFGTTNITTSTIGEVILEGVSQVLINTAMGALGGLIWIMMKGERFGNWQSFFFWAIYWTLFDAIATTIMLMIYGFFSFKISFAILPGIIGIFGLSREKQTFRQHLFPEGLKEIQYKQ